MRQRELTRLLKSLGQLTHAQRQKVMAELGAGERQAAHHVGHAQLRSILNAHHK